MYSLKHSHLVDTLGSRPGWLWILEKPKPNNSPRVFDSFVDFGRCNWLGHNCFKAFYSYSTLDLFNNDPFHQESFKQAWPSFAQYLSTSSPLVANVKRRLSNTFNTRPIMTGTHMIIEEEPDNCRPKAEPSLAPPRLSMQGGNKNTLMFKSRKEYLEAGGKQGNGLSTVNKVKFFLSSELEPHFLVMKSLRGQTPQSFGLVVPKLTLLHETFTELQIFLQQAKALIPEWNWYYKVNLHSVLLDIFTISKDIGLINVVWITMQTRLEHAEKAFAKYKPQYIKRAPPTSLLSTEPRVYNYFTLHQDQGDHLWFFYDNVHNHIRKLNHEQMSKFTEMDAGWQYSWDQLFLLAKDLNQVYLAAREKADEGDGRTRQWLRPRRVTQLKPQW